ncbi:MAG: hypothetical protein Q9162_001678 [Coniocarpon cinnabarinum]
MDSYSDIGSPRIERGLCDFPLKWVDADGKLGLSSDEKEVAKRVFISVFNTGQIDKFWNESEEAPRALAPEALRVAIAVAQLADRLPHEDVDHAIMQHLVKVPEWMAEPADADQEFPMVGASPAQVAKLHRFSRNPLLAKLLRQILQNCESGRGGEAVKLIASKIANWKNTIDFSHNSDLQYYQLIEGSPKLQYQIYRELLYGDRRLMCPFCGIVSHFKFDHAGTVDAWYPYGNRFDEHDRSLTKGRSPSLKCCRCLEESHREFFLVKWMQPFRP